MSNSEKVREIGKMRHQKMFSLIWFKSVYVLQTVLTSSGELFAFIECIQKVNVYCGIIWIS